MAVWRLRLDRTGGVAASSGLVPLFARNVSTIDPLGNVCSGTAGNATGAGARFDRPVRFYPVPAPADVVREVACDTGMIWASGLDADGATELMVFVNFDGQGKLTVYRGGGTALKHDTTLAKVDLSDGALATLTAADEHPATMLPSGLTGRRRFRPVCASILHGAIILGGEILVSESDDADGPYHKAGWGFVINTNQGHPSNWVHVWDDTGSVQQFNSTRGREWCIRVSPMYQRNAHPLSFWLCCTDYRVQPLAAGGTAPTGGRVYVAKFKRTSATSSDWAIANPNPGQPVAFKTFDFPEGAANSGVPASNCHVHTCHLAEYETQDVQLIVSLGDSQQNNRFARLIWTKTQTGGGIDDYLNGWTTVAAGDNFHGGRTTGSGAADRGTWSAQPVGVAWGKLQTFYPDEGAGEGGGGDPPAYQPSFLWGGDEEAEWLFGMQLPRPGGSQAVLSHLYGFATGFGSKRGDYLSRHRPLTGVINESRLEMAGPLVAVVNDASGTPRMSRVLYCDSPNFPDRWIQVASCVGGYADATAAYYGGKVWYAYWRDYLNNGANLPGLYRTPKPTDFTAFEPIAIGPGGTNLVHENYRVAGVGDAEGGDDLVSVTALMYVSPGVFKDGTKTLPKVPTLAKKAYKIVTKRNPSSTSKPYATTIRVSSDTASSWNTLNTAWVPGGRIRRLRAWVLDNSYGVLTPNKTLQLSVQMQRVNAGVNEATPVQYSCPDRWAPVNITGYRGFEVDPVTNDVRALIIRLTSNWAGGETADDNVFYFVVDTALDGRGSLPYPLPHSTGATAGSGPAEELTITVGATGPDLSIQSTKAWSLKLAGVVPEAGFDQYAERRVPGANLLDPATDLRYWPLFCLHAIDTDDYIEFRAACVYQAGLGGAELGFQIRKVVSGVTTTVNFGNGRQLWIPGSPLFVAIGFDGGNLHAGATLGAGAVETVTGGIDVSDWLARTPAVKFKAIRFRAGSAAEEPGEVVDFRWVGGEFSDAALTDGTIPGAFTSLDFAKGP